MLTVSNLPHLNAILNAAAACFLMGAFTYIKSGNQLGHQRCMIIALIISLPMNSSIKDIEKYSEVNIEFF